MPTQYEENYSYLVRDVLRAGNDRPSRNYPTKSVFGKSLTVHELAWGEFPILRGRRMNPTGVFGELAAFLKGPKFIDDFKAEGCNYWDRFGDEHGSIDIDYGNLWLDFDGVNQLETVLDSLANDPTGRRHIFTGWKPDNIPNLTLPCCHLLYQWYVDGNNLEMIWYQRSVDVMLGLPSDLILAAAWNIMMADQLNLQPGKMVFMLGDTHIYQDHITPANEYLARVDRLSDTSTDYFYEDNIYTFKNNSIKLINYEALDPINFVLHV